ncbi:MAG: PaaI family thioesterase [Veillonellales bacterium]
MGQISNEEANQWCFACGRNNPIGLKLSFREENDTYISHFTAGPEHQSYDGIVHGGIISTLLDEITTRYLYARGWNAVTARLEIRYRHPTPIGKELTIIGRLKGHKGHMYEMAGEIRLPDGTVTAQAKAIVAVIGEEKS